MDDNGHHAKRNKRIAMTDTRELAEIVVGLERALAEFGRAARAALESGGFIMCKDKKTIEGLGEEIRRLEHELEIAKQERKVRELREEIAREKSRTIAVWNPGWEHWWRQAGPANPFWWSGRTTSG